MSELRPITEEEVSAFHAQVARAFEGSAPTPEEIELRRRAMELDRTLGLFEEGRLVATGAIISFQLTVPGGSQLPAAGVAAITVAPTHRRRGLLTQMMRRQLEDIHEGPEALAILYASEGLIYGRFGYGVASYGAELTVDNRRSAFVRPVDLSGVRYVDPDEALEVLPAVSERVALGQPGMVGRSKQWWRLRLLDHPGSRRGMGEAYRLLHEGRQGPDGFAVYRKQMGLEYGMPVGSLHVGLLLAENPAAYASLWRHCLDMDLIKQLVADTRPTDEPLRHLLADVRALRASVTDQLWLRLVDVRSALAARTYQVEGRVSFLVEDNFCPWNNGAYDLVGGPAGASCEPARGEAELALSVGSLAACYLGGNSFTGLLRAGRVEERRPGAAARADAMFGSPVAPWCAYHF
jgi:predicted acetyltransferase